MRFFRQHPYTGAGKSTPTVELPDPAQLPAWLEPNADRTLKAHESRCGMCEGKATEVYCQDGRVIGVVCSSCLEELRSGVETSRGFLQSPSVRALLEARASRESGEFNDRMKVKYENPDACMARWGRAHV